MSRGFRSRGFLFLIALGVFFVAIFSGCTGIDREFFGRRVGEKEDLTRYVNPFIGTSHFGGGHTSPGACIPFGMTQWTPETQEYGQFDGFPPVPYYFSNSTISGFRGSHYPSGAWMGEYGCVTLMPTTGDIKTPADKRLSTFNHRYEEASPGYYSVFLNDYEIRVELSATLHSGIFKLTPYSESDKLNVIIDTRKSGGYVEVHPERREVVGYTRENGRSITPENFAGYFVIKTEKPFSSYGVWDERSVYPESVKNKGRQAGAFIRFDSDPGEEVKLKVGTSFISIDQARKNLDKEIPDWDFNGIKLKAKHTWNDELSKIEVRGGTEDQKVIFYTALYHSLLLPRFFAEDGHYYSPFDGKVHEGIYYEDFSLWDTYRAEHPLLLLINPQRSNDMIISLLNMYDEFGWTPKWPNPGYSNVMIGTHADSIIADAYTKGIRDFDLDKAYEAVLKNALELPSGEQAPGFRDTLLPPGEYEARGGLSLYKQMRYIPADRVRESVSRTLEFAYDDFCIAQLAEAMGKDEMSEYLLSRAGYYRNVFDSNEGFVRGRNSDGSWVKPFDPTGWYDYITEGTPWHYVWYVPHDVQGLIDLMGGREKFVEKLDLFFTEGSKNGGTNFGENPYYWHGNEPSHHVVYLYDFAGEPWKTQKWVREIMERAYGTTPDGLCGNDDAGQMSAWYIFSAMGFYPVCPGDSSYEIGSPIFDEVVIHLDSKYYPGRQFVIKAHNVSAENMYIQSATLNGEPLNQPWITHEMIVNGGTLTFYMGPEPNLDWGSSFEAAPPSLTRKVQEGSSGEGDYS
jgi:predicted alpha-1,2-mannosidase